MILMRSMKNKKKEKQLEHGNLIKPGEYEENNLI